ncbi:MAG: hypothetical protein ABIZ36_11280 [Gemmatimonadaceae bacterium]
MIQSLSRLVAVVIGAVAFASAVCGAQSGSGSTSMSVSQVQTAVYASSRIGISADSIPAGHPPNSDTFLGSDKVKHLLISGFVEAFGFSAMQYVGASRASSIAAASAATIAAGVGREVHDGRTKGLFSLGDLTWDALGLGSALLLISHTQR